MVWYGMVWYVAYEALTAVVASLGCATEQTSGHCEHPGAPNGTVSYGMVVVVWYWYHTIVTLGTTIPIYDLYTAMIGQIVLYTFGQHTCLDTLRRTPCS